MKRELVYDHTDALASPMIERYPLYIVPASHLSPDGHILTDFAVAGLHPGAIIRTQRGQDALRDINEVHGPNLERLAKHNPYSTDYCGEDRY